MKAKELFKTKAEITAELDKLGVAYPKIKSGANEGKVSATFKELCNIFDEHKVSITVEEPKEEIKVVEEVVVPKKKKKKRFNPMTFRF